MDCYLAKIEDDSLQPYVIIERYATSDGVRTRVCDSRYHDRRTALEALAWKNRK